MELKLIENKERDIINWQESVKRKSYGVLWANKMPEDISLECVNNVNCLNRYLENKYYSTAKIKNCIAELSRIMNTDQIQHDLESILKCKFKANNYRVFVTTFKRGPFNLREHYFFIILNEDVKRMISIIYHELMHFLFYQNWYDFCVKKELNDDQINNFKEILTVLLNEVLEKRGLPLDRGYQIHQVLRDKLLNLRKTSLNFVEFISKAIELVK